MSSNALDTLREAGIVKPNTAPAVVEILSGLNEQEARFLSSLDARIKAAMTPEVIAHSEEGEEDAPCLIGMSCGSFGSAMQ